MGYHPLRMRADMQLCVRMRSACHEDAGGVCTLNGIDTSAAYEQDNRSFACRGQDYSEYLTVTYLP